MRSVVVLWDEIGTDVETVQEALSTMTRNGDLPGMATEAIDGRMLWTYEDEGVRLYWRETQAS